MSRLRQWLASRLPELALFAVGVAVRLSMHFSYNPFWGFDAYRHWEVMDWWNTRGTLPGVTDLYCGYHPPLYYLLAGGVLHLGLGATAVQWVGIAFGILKLAIIWAGLELYLERPAARRFGLALAAVLSVNIHMDGMLTNEIASSLLATAAIVLVPKVFVRAGRARWLFATGVGTVLGLQMLSKISALICIAAIGVAVLVELLTPAENLRARVARALPWAMVVVMPLLISGWYFARNVRDYGKPFVSSFDFRPDETAAMASIAKKPYLARRPKDFVFGWSPKIFEFPCVPVAVNDDAHFTTVAVASTFVDYWNVRFSGPTPVIVPTRSSTAPK
ncbi:MAG: glycosyltransferase family 39 protein [Archangiaceae bacterium]|nr:glycosyltransferase family 39 protein [Archangiaceae bacterium]